MRAGMSKAKGSAFEREVCEKLSLWVSHGVRDDCFWRSAMSGGRATVKFQKGKQNQTQHGDISAVHPMGHKLTDLFVVECKFYRSLDIESGFLTGRGRLHSFWEEVCRVATRADGLKLPMLIAKQNRTRTLLLVRPGTFGRVVGNPLLRLYDWKAAVWEFDKVLKTRFTGVA